MGCMAAVEDLSVAERRAAGLATCWYWPGIAWAFLARKVSTRLVGSLGLAWLLWGEQGRDSS